MSNEWDPVVSVVFLEGACGHEFEWLDVNGTPPAEAVCAEHGRTELWAQRTSPRNDERLPRGRLVNP